MKRAVPLLGAVALASISVPIHAETSFARFRVSGIVSTVCRVQFSQGVAILSGNDVNLGTLTQLCNDGEGYRVIMHHPASISGSTFQLDGKMIPIGDGTETVIVDSNEPDYRLSGAMLHLASGSRQDLGNLYFRIEPKGTVY